MADDGDSDVFGVLDVLGAYCHAADRQDFDAARACYHDDAFDDHGLFKGQAEGLVDFFQRLGRSLASTSHLIGSPWVEVRGDRAWAITGLLHRMQPVAPGEAMVQCYRYLDYLERRDGRWKIARRTVVLDWDRALPEGGANAVAWARGAYGSDDPSTTFLAEATGSGGTGTV